MCKRQAIVGGYVCYVFAGALHSVSCHNNSQCDACVCGSICIPTITVTYFCESLPVSERCFIKSQTSVFKNGLIHERLGLFCLPINQSTQCLVSVSYYPAPPKGVRGIVLELLFFF